MLPNLIFNALNTKKIVKDFYLKPLKSIWGYLLTISNVNQ